MRNEPIEELRVQIPRGRATSCVTKSVANLYFLRIWEAGKKSFDGVVELKFTSLHEAANGKCNEPLRYRRERHHHIVLGMRDFFLKSGVIS
jgi:hypothetical protein